MAGAALLRGCRRRANADALGAAINLLEARARYDGLQIAVHVRVGGAGGKLYLDLGDAEWRAVEIDAQGWRIVEAPPVRFRRGSGAAALPEPERGGGVEALRAFLNLRAGQDFVLAVAWLLACLRDRGPYPVLVLAGEQGSAKSTVSLMLRMLVDPAAAPLRALSREERDLFVAATNAHVLAFDNLSGLPPWMSDTLCRLSSGAGFAVRQLYTDQDELVFDAARPVILNGIEDIVTRPDLADRALFLTLEPIAAERRRPMAELWAEFEAQRPKLLGALLGALAHGLKHLPGTALPRLPRMADFALWATACEGALFESGSFWPAYVTNRGAAIEDVIDADPVASAIVTFMTSVPFWTGTCSDLLALLEARAGERTVKSRDWPGNARKLGNRLRRIATALREAGTDIRFERTDGARVIHLSSKGKEAETTSETARTSWSMEL
ncbi:MAG: hypothetical protein KF889_24060 [Alphaproteobacteria bacterium]|nr:hypothetical protein [Alphaproteobacteria bacterium]MCW5742533.1 hypothetical protein [Alphaproteobacteria bacterium]